MKNAKKFVLLSCGGICTTLVMSVASLSFGVTLNQTGNLKVEKCFRSSAISSKLKCTVQKKLNNSCTVQVKNSEAGTNTQKVVTVRINSTKGARPKVINAIIEKPFEMGMNSKMLYGQFELVDGSEDTIVGEAQFFLNKNLGIFRVNYVDIYQENQAPKSRKGEFLKQRCQL